jgi:serine protease Do
VSRLVPLLLLALFAAPAAGQEDPRVDATVKAVELVGPAVANIATEEVVDRGLDLGGGRLEEWAGRADRRQRRRAVATSLGSGVVVDPAGWIVTNAHVVARASRIVVGLPGREELEAHLLSVLPDEDLALLKVDADGPLPSVRLAKPDDLRVGETCLALGNPFGLENTVTRGVLSARGRKLVLAGRELPGDFLQTDAAINPGNSGGPLVNLLGQLIGINTAVAASGHGIGFAVPVARVRAALARLSSPLVLRQRWLGLELDDAPDDGGARVRAVDEGSPAATAGLRPGDVVVAAGPEAITSAFGLHARWLGAADPGGVRLAIVGPDKGRRGATLTAGPPPYAREVKARLGLVVRELTPALAWRLGLGDTNAVLVDEVEPQGPADAVGVQPGDVLVRLEPPAARLAGERRGGEAQTIREVWATLRAAAAGDALTVTIRRKGRDYWGELRPR